MAVAQGLLGAAQAVLAPAGVEVAAKEVPAAPAVLALAVAEVAVAGATTQEAVEVVELVQVAAVEDLVDVARRSLLLQTLVLGVADRQRRKTGAVELVHAPVL